MSAVSRVSAFAKRRKLNDSSTAPTSESDNSSSVSPTKNAKSGKAVTHGVNATKASLQQSLDATPVHESIETDGDGNSFAPLVDAKAVSFIGTREIEVFDDNSCRARLSRGQKCTIHGIARLWVREGSICLDGAILTESSEEYTLFGSSSGSFTEIVAQSKIAEFELNSLSPCEGFLPSAINVPGKLGDLSRRGATSFEVLDRSGDGDRNSSEASADTNSLAQAITSHIRITLSKDSTTPRILVCGKRSVDTYRASVALVNRLLTSDSNNGALHLAKLEKIAFLDLDYYSPAFTAPGTISLSILQRPIFGQSYTQALQHDSNVPNYLVATQYIKAIEDTERSKLDLNCVQSILQIAKGHVNCSYWVIRTGSWFANMSSTERSRFVKLLNIDLAVCIDTNKSSRHLETAKSLPTELREVSILHLPMSPCSSLSSLQEHKLQLQSHFHVYGTVGDTPLWYREPLPDVPTVRRLALCTDATKDELRFIQVRGGVLRPQDIPNAIHQNLVVIVAVQNDESAASSIDRQEDVQRSLHVSQDQYNVAKSLLEIRKVEEHDIVHFVGLAYVEEVDVKEKKVTLNIPVSMDSIQHHKSLGREIGLILEKPGTDGRFGRHLLFT